MDQNKTSKEILLRMVKSFTENEVAPFDMEIDHTRSYVNDLLNKIKETDLLSTMLPKEYGGAGFDGSTTAKMINEIARGNASLAVTLEGHFKSIDQIVKFGNQALKDKYLPQAKSRIIAFSMTEPSGGSNPLGINSHAEHVGDKWIINGDKIMITNGGLAEIYCVLVKTAPEELSFFVIDKDMEGFEFGKQENFLGLTGVPVGEIVMNNIEVNESHLLGKVGMGKEIGDSAHNDARVLMGAVLTGIMEHELDIVTDYATHRKAIDTPIIQMQGIQRKVADIAIAKETTKLLYQKAAWLKDNRQDYEEEAAMAKAYGSRSAVKSGDDALQILGGYGYSLDYPVEHLIRDARAMELAEGTVEKMRTEIALIEAKNRA
ncbi:acyl-CoA dehydrogenase family protein [Companilactobacillus pabuli]|jgi:Acyl-CoA dehydrogenases|uniref:Acyl-CoA dehydrogenase n=1 Tax=Companilactobacillus pabuli TaxID=2714036 RepID=A0A7L7KZE1_9LACO|nr:acyl-CoA dehydrogenase family protein [Companilactobacillus pabuli]AKP02551.1 acyl-CoA dehydrogenase [Companilactobacillus farciminis]AKS50849.1 acyl-CoA dehydrogenase [Companilactobacillus farciminis]QMT84732.1 acyl-CoA dehydrogenase [Companilactobacillus pabuli]